MLTYETIYNADVALEWDSEEEEKIVKFLQSQGYEINSADDLLLGVKLTIGDDSLGKVAGDKFADSGDIYKSDNELVIHGPLGLQCGPEFVKKFLAETSDMSDEEFIEGLNFALEDFISNNEISSKEELYDLLTGSDEAFMGDTSLTFKFDEEELINHINQPLKLQINSVELNQSDDVVMYMDNSSGLLAYAYEMFDEIQPDDDVMIQIYNEFEAMAKDNAQVEVILKIK